MFGDVIRFGSRYCVAGKTMAEDLYRTEAWGLEQMSENGGKI